LQDFFILSQKFKSAVFYLKLLRLIEKNGVKKSVKKPPCRQKNGSAVKLFVQSF